MGVGMWWCASKKNKVDNLQDDLFAFKINYNDADTATDLFNGNISETYWKTSTNNKKRKYDYKYDDLNRLLQADYSKQGNTAFNSYLEHLWYDKNGNIQTLLRNGGMDTDGYQFANPIDNLTYLYDTDNKNQLLRVFDATANPQGFKDDTDGSNISIDVAQEPDYKYDANGNMTKDDNKGIKTITYNHLNLPTKITFVNGNFITYLYNAVGQKVNKVVTENSMVTTTEYLNGFQYVNSVLQFFPHAEGYVNATQNGTGYFFNYVFNYTDHLGNIRLSYAYDPNSKPLRVIEENHYYPFGLKHSGYNSDKMMYIKEGANIKIKPVTPFIKTSYDYKYNGKELQDELGLNMYDYGARNYDAAIGRWMNIDPLAETSRRWSTYTYCYNNPMYFVDPDGMLAKPPGDFYDRTGNYLGTDGNKDNRIYLLNEGMRVKSENKDVNWGGTLSKIHSNNLKNNSTEVGGLIILNRTDEGKDFTVGEFKTTGDKPVEGFTVEPGGPATTESGTDKRIPEGVYDLTPHQSDKYPGSFKVSNDEVSKDRAILIHSGNTGKDTEGCILPGTNKTSTGVSASKPKLKEVYNFINENSKEKPVKLIINEKIK